MRSSAASCWLTAGCEYPRRRAAPWKDASLGEGLKRGQVADLDPVPSAPPHAFGHLCSLSCAAPSPGDIWPDIDPTPSWRFS